MKDRISENNPQRTDDLSNSLKIDKNVMRGQSHLVSIGPKRQSIGDSYQGVTATPLRTFSFPILNQHLHKQCIQQPTGGKWQVQST